MKFHPSASDNFNNKIQELLFDLAPETKGQKNSFSFMPDVFVSKHFSDKDIVGEIKFGKANYLGEEVAKYFEHNGRQIGLEEEKYRKLEKIVEQMQKTKELSKKISKECLKEIIFEWIRCKYKNLTSLSMTDYVLENCRNKIKDIEIWIPINLLYVESDFKIGRITFKTITSQMFEKWQDNALKNQPQYKDKLTEYYIGERKQIQGLAAGTIKLAAEPKRAFEIALEETEKSLSILRLFSGAAFCSKVISYCEVFNKKSIPGYKYFSLSPNGLLSNYCSSQKPVERWTLNNDYLNKLKEFGIERFSLLLDKDQKTSLESILLDSLLLYSKSCTKEDLADRLVYMFVALENILLKNNSEPIQNNISERMAFIIGKNSKERKEIINNFKEAYSLRSSFIHHGNTIDEIEVIDKFMQNTWDTFSELVSNPSMFKTKDELIDALENRRLA